MSLIDVMMIVLLGAAWCFTCIMVAWRIAKRWHEHDDVMSKILHGTMAVLQMTLCFNSAKTLIITPIYCYQMEQKGAKENAQVYQEMILQEDKSSWVNWAVVEEYFEKDD